MNRYWQTLFPGKKFKDQRNTKPLFMIGLMCVLVLGRSFAQPPCFQTSRVASVVPQPITRNALGQLEQSRGVIHVYLMGPSLDVATAQDSGFYHLVSTNGTLTNLDDQIFLPVSATYEPSNSRIVLDFGQDLVDLLPGPDVFRLHVNDATSLRQTPTILSSPNPGETFSTAFDMGSLSEQPLYIHSSIDHSPFPLEHPGSDSEPGHSNEAHTPNGPDTDQGITYHYYNFKSSYGEFPPGTPLSNGITEQQKALVRDGFCWLGENLGVSFVESDQAGTAIVVGDLRTVDPGATNAPGGDMALNGSDLLVFDATESWEDHLLGNFQEVFFNQTGQILGLGLTPDLPPPGMMNPDGSLANGQPIARVFPGNHDLLHLQHTFRPEGSEIDLFQFELHAEGRINIELFAARISPNASRLDAHLRLFKLDLMGQFNEIARNGQYFGPDPFMDLELGPGVYQVGISSRGNEDYDPNRSASGFGGTTEGDYQLLIDWKETYPAIFNEDQEAFDGDGDGSPGGAFDFWFCVQPSSSTLYVDKQHDPDAGLPMGTISNPFNSVANALAAAGPEMIVRLTANGGPDQILASLDDNYAYEFGVDPQFTALMDGANLIVPKDVCVMVDPGVILKMGKSFIGVGSHDSTDRSGGVLQMLGAVDLPVTITSYQDENIGFDTYPLTTIPLPGDWGGIYLESDLDRGLGRTDREALGQFATTIAQTAIFYGGGLVLVNSLSVSMAPVTCVDTRPTVISNIIEHSSISAMGVSPKAFLYSRFTEANAAFSPDFERRGPLVYGNLFGQNSLNGIHLRITGISGTSSLLSGTCIWDDWENPHVLSDVLEFEGCHGRYEEDSSTLDLIHKGGGVLVVKPGVTIKVANSALIIGSGGALFAEGSESAPIVMTSISDDAFGGCYDLDTNGDGSASVPAEGDWGGIIFRPVSSGSLKNVTLSYAGGDFLFAGAFLSANPIEVHQARFRLSESIFHHNGPGTGGATANYRQGLGENQDATIFSSQSQPIILGNRFHDNLGPIISLDVNDMASRPMSDLGPQTCLREVEPYLENQGPLIRENLLQDNGINGMTIRGGTLTAQSVWDDADIVHVIESQVIVHNFHSSGGIRLESSYDQSLVVKGRGGAAGFTVSGGPLAISDRIGGMFQMVDQSNAPVILTSFYDDNFGAGLDFNMQIQMDTNGDGPLTTPILGDWAGVVLDSWAHERLFGVYVEQENPDPLSPGSNDDELNAEVLGVFDSSGTALNSLGTEIHGVLKDPADVDVYQFQSLAGNEVWLDIDQTRFAVDCVVQLIHQSQVIAESDDSYAESQGTMTPSGIAIPFSNHDYWTWNPSDPGMMLTLPGAPGFVESYQIKVKSQGSLSQGLYQMQIRFQAVDDFPGSFCSGPLITQEPESSNACSGEPVELSVVAFSPVMFGENNFEPLSYLWFKDGEPLPETNTPNLSILNPGPQDAGVYSVAISDSCGTTMSQDAEILTTVDISISPKSSAQGLQSVHLDANITCTDGNTHWDWVDRGSGQVLAQDQLGIELPILQETTFVDLVLTAGPGAGMEASATVLVASDPSYFDINSDGCNTLDDLHSLLELWRTSLAPDPSGDSFMDVRDYLFINTDDLSCGGKRIPEN